MLGVGEGEGGGCTGRVGVGGAGGEHWNHSTHSLDLDYVHTNIWQALLTGNTSTVPLSLCLSLPGCVPAWLPGCVFLPRRFFSSVATETRKLKGIGYHILVFKAAHQRWVKILRDRPGDRKSMAAGAKKTFHMLLAEHRKVTSLTAEAALKDKARSSMRDNLQQAACCVLLLTGFLIGLLLATISAFRQAHRPVLLVTKRCYDETPSKINVSYMNAAEQAKHRVKEEGTAKVLQSQCELTMLVEHLPSAAYYTLRLAMPTWLQCVDRSTAENIAACQSSILKLVPGLSDFGQQAKFNVHLVTTDAYSANLKAERSLTPEGQNSATSHYLCDIHKAATCQTKTLHMIDGHVSGMISVALACADASATRGLRMSLQRVLSEKLRVCFGKPPQSEGRDMYKSAVMNAFLPLREGKEDGEEDLVATPHAQLRKRRQRALLQFFLNDDWQDSSEVVFWTETFGLDGERLLQLMSRYLLPVLVPSRPPIFSRSRWNGFQEALQWFGLAEAVHGLLRPAILDFLAPKPSQALPNVGAAAEQQQQQLTEGPDEAADDDDLFRQQLDAMSGDINWADLKLRMKQKAATWLQQPILPILVIANLAVSALAHFFNRLLALGSPAWEKIQQTRVATGNSRTFAVLEAARGTDLNIFRAQVAENFQNPIWHMPADMHLRYYQVLLFRMLSRSLCSIEFHIGTAWQAYPVKLFSSLDQRHPVTEDPACTLCNLSKLLLDTYGHQEHGFSCEEAQHVLATLASNFALDISHIESRHATTRRVTQVKSTHVKAPELCTISADWTCRQNVIRRTELLSEASQRGEDALTQDADEGQTDNRRRITPLQAYLSDRRTGDRGRFTSEKMRAWRQEFLDLDDERKRHYEAMADVANFAKSRGHAPFARVQHEVLDGEPPLQVALAPNPDQGALATLGAAAQSIVQQEIEQCLLLVRRQHAASTKIARDWLQAFEEARADFQQEGEEVFQEIMSSCAAFKTHYKPSLTGLLSADVHVPADHLGEDVLSKGERSQIRAELLQEWQDLNDMFVHEEQEKLESHEQLPSKCAQLGLCVCDGAGLQCWVYHERLVWFLKPHFTPRRVRRQRDAEGRMVHVELPPAEKQAQSKLKSNRKALEDGFVVVRIRVTDSEALPADIPLCASVHPSWGRLGLESLGYRSVASEASTDCLWLHLGHVNYSTGQMREDIKG
ncbi:unnamed protein product [Symbiodinium microadriaticum]|nr:unnamed protein product [Symbiodinium microadriaticum]CAE7385035.1 unnamed protein product [Symbiodinium sp. KB8]